MFKQYNPSQDEWFLKMTNDKTVMLYNNCTACCGSDILHVAYEIHKNGEDLRETLMNTVQYSTEQEYNFYLNGFTLYSKRRFNGKIKVLDNDYEISKFLRVFHNRDKVEAVRVGHYIQYQCECFKNHFAFFKYNDVFYEVSCNNMTQVLRGLREIIRS